MIGTVDCNCDCCDCDCDCDIDCEDNNCECEDVIDEIGGRFEILVEIVSLTELLNVLVETLVGVEVLVEVEVLVKVEPSLIFSAISSQKTRSKPDALRDFRVSGYNRMLSLLLLLLLLLSLLLLMLPRNSLSSKSGEIIESSTEMPFGIDSRVACTWDMEVEDPVEDEVTGGRLTSILLPLLLRRCVGLVDITPRLVVAGPPLLLIIRGSYALNTGRGSSRLILPLIPLFSPLLPPLL